MLRVNGHVVRALTVAGSDSGGGAGIQADLKTFAAFGVYGASVITGLTAQNTLGVQGVRYVDPAFVREQMRSVLTDIGADAAKTGMLGSAAIIEAVAEGFAEYPVRALIVDPVMVAKGGEPLLDADAVSVLKQRLLPLASVVTPNLPEAEALVGGRIVSWDDCHQAARELFRFTGGGLVVIKGGHVQKDWAGQSPYGGSLVPHAVDVVFDGDAFTYFAAMRIPSHRTHGTGCTFSAAITAARAAGASWIDAIASAKAFISEAIRRAQDWDVGGGHGPTDHSAPAQVVHGLSAGRCYAYVGGTWEEVAGRRGNPV
ncbi:hydroxymethylpyrimidine/phosphomethylpyrimidine kinase [Alicyclobacillus cellulosilyticus]|uniref:Hydroxymethylpyrimidine/phosphomethylpyrimidine kinase n=1 Tax=Alicyclobacillus cellulosilyticus TaxID=1003997 RepID=A0A917KGL7_9BACL|nr:bifunctional hydroxymethylpyrimidine kinase/phosphomethylpyrimidine kinase [Alicyclobacillus cellulosilyticus]GGJ11532.1 hydroxymethylpyrimidine/phosphomethylpyrimidine kinase [Alicyclobacillus cellulosilyticus]